MTNTHRITELDGARGIAAVFVCLNHFFVFPYGGTGVDLFFMISGFVIYMSVTHTGTLKQFWISRFIRLYPVYVLSFIIAIIFCAQCYTYFRAFRVNEVIGNLTLLQPLFKANSVNFVYWTLYVEMLFYILISLLWKLNLLDQIEKVIVCLFILIAIPAITYVILRSSNLVYERYFIGLQGVIQLFSFFHLFAAGILFYRIYTDGVTRTRVLLIVTSFFFIPLQHYNTVDDKLDLADQHLYADVVYYLLFVLIITHKALFLNIKPLQFLGKISYALYLIHTTFGIWVMNIVLPVAGKAIAVCTCLTLSILLAYVITRYYDDPLRAVLKKYLKL